MSGFTFGILAYNQEKLIVQTLESMKYQVLTYGTDMACTLIVIDDCSKDRTVSIVRRWMEQNASVFEHVQLIENEQNQGTVYNYNRLLEMIGEENFKILAGDDLISSGNLFEKYAGLDEKSLYTFPRMELVDGKICYNEEMLKLYFYNQQHPGHHLARVCRGGYIHTPSTLYNKLLYNNAHCKELNEKFRLFEDDPTWYSMIKNVSELEIQFHEEPVVLYRIHQQSVSNSVHAQKSEFDLEMDRLHVIYRADAKGLRKIYWMFRNCAKLPKYLNVSKYADYMVKHVKMMCVSRKESYRRWKAQMDAHVKTEQEYYDEIEKRTVQFMEGEC